MNIAEKIRLFITVVPKESVKHEIKDGQLTIIKECGCVYCDNPLCNKNEQSIDIQLCNKHNDRRLLDAKFRVGQKVRYTDEAIDFLRDALDLPEENLAVRRECEYVVQSVEISEKQNDVVVVIRHTAEDDDAHIVERHLTSQP